MFEKNTKQNSFRSQLIQAPMAGVSTPQLAATVSNSGAIGSLAIGNLDIDQAISTIEQTKALTDQPFNINFFCHDSSIPLSPAKDQQWRQILNDKCFQGQTFLSKPLQAIYSSIKNNLHFAEAICDMQPKILSFHFGIPDPSILMLFKKTGAKLLATATSLAEAKLIAQNGFDAIIAQGYEAGGHRGIFDMNNFDAQLSTHTLTNILIDKIKLPIIAAGGIMSGHDIAAYKKIGVHSVQLGTAFIGCKESATSIHYKQLLQSQAAYATTMTRVISGRPARSLMNELVEWGMHIDANTIADYPYAYDAIKQIIVAKAQENNFDIGGYWAGQGAPFARFMPASDLITQLEREYLQENNP